VLLFLPSVAALASSPGNLLANAELDLDTSSWVEVSPAFSDLQPHASDHDACAGAGSGEAINSGTIPAASATFRQCVTGIQAEVEHSFGAHLYFASGQATSGHAYMLVHWMGGPGCSNQLLAAASPSVPSSTTDQWVRSANALSTPPAGTSSADVRIFLNKAPDTGSLAVRFDGVYLAATPGQNFADGFESASDCRWTLAAP
jgi:hypothetical protein